MPYLLTLAFFLFAPPVLAATYQQCTTSSTCVIGEFLYDDEYQPQTDAICTLTAKYPDGSDFLTASASAGSNAWYYYDAAIGTTEGLYPANLCCCSDADYLCLYKSFEVKAAAAAAAATSLTAADVWNYSSRSLTSFGSLITDTWNHSTRSLTTFGDLISNIWNYSSATTTAPAVITNLVQEQTEQRVLLEKLVNTPVVTLSLDEGQSIPDLNTKLEQSQIQANALYESVQNGKINNPELLALADVWNAPIIIELNLATSLKKLTLLEKLVGRPNDDSQQPTLFGFLSQISERNESLKAENQKLAVLLDGWNGQGESGLEKAISASRKQILALNEYPGGSQLLQPAKTSPDRKLTLKNIVFNLQALLGLNRQMLAAAPGDPLRSLWLEEGSVIFRAAISNPSTVISQTVPLKFYLPREIKTNDIITLDPSLTTQYDTTEEALYVTGSYTLLPLETKLVFIEVQDIWQLSESETTTLRKQATELLRPLEKTSYFSQGTVLKSEIDVNLDKILLAQNKAITPENRIRAFREAQLELNGVNTNIDRLQDLVAQAANTGSIFGFVGGVQTVAVWGILLIVIASFVFLTIYMRQLKLPAPKTIAAPKLQPIFWSKPALIPIIVILTSLATVLITQLLFKPKTAAPPAILQVAEPSPSPSLKPQEIKIKQEKQVLGESTPRRLAVPENSSVNIRNKPSPDAPIIMTVKTTVDVFVFIAKGDWSRIDFSPTDTNQSWWVSSQFLD